MSKPAIDWKGIVIWGVTTLVTMGLIPWAIWSTSVTFGHGAEIQSIKGWEDQHQREQDLLDSKLEKRLDRIDANLDELLKRSGK